MKETGLFLPVLLNHSNEDTPTYFPTPSSSIYPASAAEEMQKDPCLEILPSLLKFVQSQTKDSTPRDVERLLLNLPNAVKNEILLQYSQAVEIELLNVLGDGRIKFIYDIANFGLVTCPGRLHQFWFELPQDQLTFICKDGAGSIIPTDVSQTTPHCFDVRLHFPTPLASTQRMQYSVEYQVKGNFLTNPFYYVRTRTITNHLSLSVLAPKHTIFDKCYVAQESTDGFTRDDPPQLKVISEDSRSKIEWSALSPRTGDLFRTFWSLKA